MTENPSASRSIESSELRTEGVVRRPYQRPVVTCFGRVEDLTRAGGTSNCELGCKKPKS